MKKPKKPEILTVKTTEGVDFSWHTEGDEIVIDRWNIGGKPMPFDEGTFRQVWPDWMFGK